MTHESRNPAIPGAVTRHTDKTMGMTRVEITCTACGGHLGHVFKGEGFSTPSASREWCKRRFRALIGSPPRIADERHCVNSVSLKFKDEE